MENSTVSAGSDGIMGDVQDAFGQMCHKEKDFYFAHFHVQVFLDVVDKARGYKGFSPWYRYALLPLPTEILMIIKDYDIHNTVLKHWAIADVLCSDVAVLYSMHHANPATTVYAKMILGALSKILIDDNISHNKLDFDYSSNTFLSFCLLKLKELQIYYNIYRYFTIFRYFSTIFPIFPLFRVRVRVRTLASPLPQPRIRGSRLDPAWGS